MKRVRSGNRRPDSLSRSPVSWQTFPVPDLTCLGQAKSAASAAAPIAATRTARLISIARLAAYRMLPAATMPLEERPYWDEGGALLEAPETAGGPLPARVDVAVVGGGYTGLSAGLRLARGGARVVVLDKHAIGGGASSRNGGQVLTGL